MAATTKRSRNETCALTCDVQFVHEDRIERVAPQVPAREAIEPAARILAAIGDPTKLRILLALSVDELCVCDIAYVLDMKKSAISHQLRLLRDRGLVRCRKEGRIAYYSLATETVGALVHVVCDLAQEIQLQNGGG